MKIIFWGAIVAFALMPVNFAVLMIAKLIHREPFVPEDAILFAVALFGLLMSYTIHRNWIYKKKAKE